MDLEKNSNLISFCGIIGRRDYFLNFVYICMIASFSIIPQQSYIINNIGSIDNIFKLNEIIYSAPLWIKAWIIFTSVFLSTVSISNAIRRLNDINGVVNRTFNIAASIIIALSGVSIFFPIFIAAILVGFVFGLNIYLLFTSTNYLQIQCYLLSDGFLHGH